MEYFKDHQELPPLPEFTLVPEPPLLPFVSDKFFLLVIPIIAYWALSMFFHWIDVNDYFSKYRLHTPAEVLKRNHVSRWEVLRDVILQQIIQLAVGHLLNMTEPDEFTGQSDYDIAVWARRVRIAQKLIPGLLALTSINAQSLASSLQQAHPMISGVIAGGTYPTLTRIVTLAGGAQEQVPVFATWEVTLAKVIYYAGVPALQFIVAILFLDTWQYFLHRAMHMNKWLYSELFSLR